jgi:hypothetical protein
VTALLILLEASLTSILAIVSTVAAYKFREQRDATRANLDRARPAERKREAELGRSLLGQARAVRYSGQPARRSDAPVILGRAARIAHAVDDSPEHLAERRDEVIAALALVDDHPAQTWSGVPPIDFLKTYNVEADRYVDIDFRGLIHAYRLSNRSGKRVMGADRSARRSWPVFVPGGRFVHMLSDDSRMELWNIDRGEQPTTLPADVHCVAARADGKQVAVFFKRVPGLHSRGRVASVRSSSRSSSRRRFLSRVVCSAAINGLHKAPFLKKTLIRRLPIATRAQMSRKGGR